MQHDGRPQARSGYRTTDHQVLRKYQSTIPRLASARRAGVFPLCARVRHAIERNLTFLVVSRLEVRV
jgi:hypothetical protein